MSDFPPQLQQITDMHLSTVSGVYGPYLRGVVASPTPATLTWVSGLAVYVPFFLPFPYVVRRVWWSTGSTITSTSADMGIYTVSGVKLYSTTPTAMAGAQSAQYVSLSTPLVLQPGNYYLAWTCNNTTSRGYGIATATADVGQRLGLLQQTSVATLPDPATFAAYSTGPGLPLCGLTRTASGF